MAFRVRDLVINVVPQEGDPNAAITAGCGCFQGSFCPQATCFECTQDFTICRPCSATQTLGCGHGCSFEPSYCDPCTHSGGTVCQQCTFNSPTFCIACSLANPTICPNHSVICKVWTSCPGVTRCPGGTIACDFSRIDPLPIDPESLAALKSQLRKALADVEAHEEALSERMAPQTVEDAEALEQKLEEALEEVRARKDKLREKGSEGGA